MDTKIEVSFYVFEKLLLNVDLANLPNEAQTRIALIDSILFDCLGWDKNNDVLVEPRSNDGYIDYLISTTRRIFIIEAKKAGEYFQLPKTSKLPSAVSIKALVSNNDNLKKAIIQAATYSQQSGVPYTLVSNGHQFVAFIGSRGDGNSPLDGRAIVFSSLEQVKTNFVLFWNLFSKPGMECLNLRNTLLSKAEVGLPAKLSAIVNNYPGIHRRNDLQTDLSILSELILEDLLHDDLEVKFLNECYCDSGALSQYSLLAKNIIKERYYQEKDESTLNTQSINSKKGINPNFLGSALSRRPIILLGDVGVGKSIFIRKLIKLDPEGVFKNDFAIHVNLGDKLILVENVLLAIAQEVVEILYNDHGIDIQNDDFVRRVYTKELKKFSESINKSLPIDTFSVKEIEYLETLISDKSAHLRKSVEYISLTGKSITIFLDNIDQRNAEDQQSVYLASQELASQTSAVVFVSIRPETFYRSNEDGVLKAYHQRAFTIDPPRIDLVLLKRLNFGLAISKGDIPIPRLDSEYGTKLTGLSYMLTAFIRSIHNPIGRQKMLIEFIDNFASGNVRSAVDMVKDFLSSGHVNSAKIIQIEQEKSNYLVPLHEFIKSVIYGNTEHYDPNSSSIKNLFDINTSDSKEHFLKIVLLRILEAYADSAESDKGFIDTSNIYDSLQAFGYQAEQIDLALNYCLKNEIIESSMNYIIHESVQTVKKIRITNKGACYTRLLINQFTYVDAMLVDTPILDPLTRDELGSNFSDSSIQSRLPRATIFIEYLNGIFDRTLRGKERQIDKYWDETYKKLNDDIRYITSKQNNNQ